MLLAGGYVLTTLSSLPKFLGSLVVQTAGSIALISVEEIKRKKAAREAEKAKAEAEAAEKKR